MKFNYVVISKKYSADNYDELTFDTSIQQCLGVVTDGA